MSLIQRNGGRRIHNGMELTSERIPYGITVHRVSLWRRVVRAVRGLIGN